jgi:acyl carrier protein
MMSVMARVQRTVGRVLGVPAEEVRIDALKSDFSRWDSLRHVDLVMEIEAEFGCSLTLQEMTAIGSVRDIVELVDHKREA